MQYYTKIFKFKEWRAKEGRERSWAQLYRYQVNRDYSSVLFNATRITAEISIRKNKTHHYIIHLSDIVHFFVCNNSVVFPCFHEFFVYFFRRL